MIPTGSNKKVLRLFKLTSASVRVPWIKKRFYLSTYVCS